MPEASGSWLNNPHKSSKTKSSILNIKNIYLKFKLGNLAENSLFLRLS